MMYCCLCLAYGDERPCDVLNAGGLPLCYEHNASIIERSRKPQPVRTVVIGSPEHVEEDFLNNQLLKVIAEIEAHEFL